MKRGHVLAPGSPNRVDAYSSLGQSRVHHTDTCPRFLKQASVQTATESGASCVRQQLLDLDLFAVSTMLVKKLNPAAMLPPPLGINAQSSLNIYLQDE